MKPGILKWATNDNFAAGPDVGTPTKVPPSVGQEADGYYRNNKPAAKIWNYNRWGVDEKLEAIELMRAKTWLAPVMDPPAFSVVADVAGYDPISKRHSIYGLDGALSQDYEAYSDFGGRYWDVQTLGGSTTLNNFTDFSVDNLGTGIRAVVQSAAGGIHASTALGAYVQWAGPPAFTASKIGHDWIGLWVTDDTATTDLYRSTGPGSAFVSTFTGFNNVGADIVRIGHTHHPAGILYPDDPGNQLWFAHNPLLAVGNSEFATSSDGITWAIAGSPTVGSVLDTAYGWYKSRFISICSEVTGGLGRIIYSDDNGVTWAALNVIPYRNIATPTKARIVTDGYGVWIVNVIDAAGPPDNCEMFCSVDNGATWYPVFVPNDNRQHSNQILPCLYYGEGVFVMALTDADNVFQIYHSLVSVD
jgi:hypothetical protein